MSTNQIRHFLRLTDFTPEETDALLERAAEFRAMHRDGVVYQPFRGIVLAMIFQQASTRTRTAFEAGMGQLGGTSVYLSSADTQLGRGEPIEDTARVLSEMAHLVTIRTADHGDLDKFAAFSRVPVINALTGAEHPCQILADMQTFIAQRGSIRGAQVAFVGDGHNMCASYIAAAAQFGFALRIASPAGYRPAPELTANRNDVTLHDDPREAVRGCDLVVTDVWSSMGHEGEESGRLTAFEGFQIDHAMLDLAHRDVLFMHCLPAHRGEEVSATLLDDPRSVVWQEAGNRLHTQKALMEYLLTRGRGGS